MLKMLTSSLNLTCGLRGSISVLMADLTVAVQRRMFQSSIFQSCDFEPFDRRLFFRSSFLLFDPSRMCSLTGEKTFLP